VLDTRETARFLGGDLPDWRDALDRYERALAARGATGATHA
jgi:hypothetical protein